MPTNKFEFEISGIQLNEAQKSAISAAISTAVINTLVGSHGQFGHFGELLKGRVWGNIGGIGPINGGRMLFAESHAKLKETLNVAIR